MNNQVSTYTPSAAPCGPPRPLRYKESTIAEIAEYAENTRRFAEKYLKLLTLLLLLIGLADAMHANDIRLSEGLLVPIEGASHDHIVFDIEWDNSWRYPFTSGINNWDAAWVFVKYREVGVTGSAWSHLYLSNTAGNYSAGIWQGEGAGPAEVQPGLVNPSAAHAPAVEGNPAERNPVVGAFVYRGSVGQGRFRVSGVALAFDPAENGMDETKLYEIRVFAIEMVYVPQGTFSVGDGTTTNVRGHFRDGGSNIPYVISSENQLTLGGTTAGNLANNNASGMITADDFNSTTTQTLPAAFPKGFEALYLMKYSITQQQYVDFLNTLMYTQQDARIDGAPDAVVGTFAHNANRHGIRIAVSGVSTTTPAVYETTFPFVANNYMNWADGAAYTDWAGLRPITELEYEKAARGPLAPVANEYAWGSNAITGATGITDSGLATERASNTGANAVFGTPGSGGPTGGPLRVGAFAAANTTRAQAGASYWGIMELSGNVLERTVSVGNTTGREFTGLHGNGSLDAGANADVSNWPGTDAIGSGFRGGNWFRAIELLRVSDRGDATRTDTNRFVNHGFRGVRTAGCFNDASAPTFDTSGGLSPSQASAGQLLTYKVNGTGDYLWVVPNDWQIVSGQGTNEILVLSGPIPATMRVAATNTCGAGAEAKLTVTVAP
jgi:formylglycine-generating enzyme required for sulfatase activity